MDTCHQRRVFRQLRWHGDATFLELLSSISQVELIEHTVMPVLSQRAPVLLTERLSLGKQATQISTFGQFITVQRLINPITAHLIVVLANRYCIDTLTRLQTDVPVILRHTRNHMIVSQVPTRPDITIFYPDITILISKRNLRDSVLHKDAGVRLTIQMHDFTLIVHQILDSQR